MLQAPKSCTYFEVKEKVVARESYICRKKYEFRSKTTNL